MSGWLAAIDETDAALTIQYPTRLDLLPEILALEEAVESDRESDANHRAVLGSSHDQPT